MVALKFDFRDLFRTTRLAFSFQRLWIQFTGLFVGYGLYLILVYAGAVLSGGDLTTLWIRHGLMPLPGAFNLAWYGWILVGMALFILAAAWLVTSTAVARAAYMNLKGNTFYTWKEAFRFALRKKAISVIATPVAILAIAFFTGLGGVVVGLIARIPFVGPIGVSLLTVVWFAAAFFIVFTLAASVVAFLITPAVLATTDDDAFEGIFQSFSILFSQPWRLVSFEILTGALSVIGFAVFAFFCKLSWRVMTTLLIWGMGEDYANISYQAAYHLQARLYPAVIWMKTALGESFTSFFFAHHFVALKLPGLLEASALIAGIFLILISAYVFSYLLACFNVGNALIFLVLKKLKDDENLLERKDKEEEEPEEMTQEPVGTEASPAEIKKEDVKAKPKKTAPAKKTGKTIKATKTAGTGAKKTKKE
ncbi:MAG TPA: hypothetical protein ENN17_06965 [bacterium]|nr:hypothetical protein [bacterium]